LGRIFVGERLSTQIEELDGGRFTAQSTCHRRRWRAHDRLPLCVVYGSVSGNAAAHRVRTGHEICGRPINAADPCLPNLITSRQGSKIGMLAAPFGAAVEVGD
jgi:hypothetical protein